MRRWVEIRLKVPDNTAYTALVTLRRLGVPVAHVERARLVQVQGEDEAALLARVERDEELFNANLHEASVLPDEALSAGEVRIWPRSARSDIRRWRLRDENGAPLDTPALRRACAALLCNPAIEEAELPA